MSRPTVSRSFTRLWTVVIFVLALSGFAQMPIFKRYYIADLPGLGWLADFYFTHKLHYVAAAVLLGMVGWQLTVWLLSRVQSWRLTAGGWLRVALLGGILATGAVRMLKNQPGVSFSPELTLVVDWAHLGFVMLLGMAALALRIFGRGGYAVRRTR